MTKRTWTWSKTWRRADVNAYAARFLLILACLYVVLMVAGAILGKDTGNDPLWVLGLTAASLGFRALARLDELAYETRDRLRALEVRLDAAHQRLDDQIETLIELRGRTR